MLTYVHRGRSASHLRRSRSCTAFGSKPDTGADPKRRESIQSDEFVGDGRRGL